MRDLISYAEQEMARAGLYDQDADYGGMIPASVMKLIRVHAAEGHSGGSHALVMEIFTKLANFKTLTPLTSSPDEWHLIEGKFWQNQRDSSCFSTDGGQTYYSIDDPKREVKSTQPLG